MKSKSRMLVFKLNIVAELLNVYQSEQIDKTKVK